MTRLLSRLLAAFAFLLLAASPSLAQNYNVAANALAVGRGTNVSAFTSIAPAATSKFLVGGGTSAIPVFQTMSGDCSLVAGAVTCTKTNGVAFATSATTDATNASNIGSGTLPNARLDAEVQCIAGLTSAADKLPYFTGSGTCALGDLSSAMRTFMTTQSSANLRSVLTDETGTGADYFQGGDAGTPSAINLTNGTALPISGLTGSTSTALGLGSVELGAASDTTISRVSAGKIAVEGVNVVTTSSTDTLTNKSLTSPVITGTPDVQQALLLSGDISPTQIVANTNDYAPTGFSTATTLRLNTDASRNITGLAGGAGGRVIIIHNVGAFPIVLTNQDAGSTAANRFLFGGDMTLAADTSVTIKYDATSSRWRAITSPGSGGGGGGGVTSVTVAAGPGLSTSGTCTITTSGTCTVAAISYATTATAAGTTTLTVSSALDQHFTGSSTQTITLPVVSTMVLGQSFNIYNDSTGGRLTVNSSGGNLVQTMGVGTWARVSVISTSGTTAASWSVQYNAPTTPWVIYTPTYTAFGTVSSSSVWSRRVGDSLEIRGKFTAGTVTASEARVTLGFNGVDQNVTSDATKVPAIQLAGLQIQNGNGAVSLYMLVESNIGYLTFGIQSSTQSALTKTTGTNVVASSGVVSFTATVPIANW